MKIYNEVVIDMNTGETIYEDSFEYSGDIALCCGVLGGPIPTNPEEKAKWDKMKADREAAADKASREYGLESLDSKQFFEADGTTPKPIDDIARLIVQHKPAPEGIAAGKWLQDTKKKIAAAFPKMQEVDKEEKGFAKEAYEKDVYGIQKEAGKAGAQMRGAYGGMGGGMRGAIGGTADISQQFEQAGQAYEKDIYGLEKRAEAEFEGDVGSFLTSAFKQGGRVPSNKKSFLEVLTKLPDAGGS